MKDLYYPSNIEAKENAQDSLVSMEALVNKNLDAYFWEFKIDSSGESGFFCKVEGCYKGFRGLEYLVRHFRKNHTEILDPCIWKAKGVIYFENYMNDPNAPNDVAGS
ncbi:hypothetical protein SUGI_0526280 [Cryptomeria japonica]|nr:hypothetical protein SUGI_0526280 [Cryptomeria japonica]